MTEISTTLLIQEFEHTKEQLTALAEYGAGQPDHWVKTRDFQDWSQTFNDYCGRFDILHHELIRLNLLPD